MVKIILVPQFPVDGRYQKYWAQWWEEELRKLGAEVVTLGIDVESRKPYGAYFAPVWEHLIWDCLCIEQLAATLKREDADMVLFLDFDFSGVQQGAIPLLKKMCPATKFAAYVHAGSWCRNDFFADVRRSKFYIEFGAAMAFDYLLFPTDYARKRFLNACYSLNDYLAETQIEPKCTVVGSVWKPYLLIEKVVKDKKYRNLVVINGSPTNSNLEEVEEIARGLLKVGVEVVVTSEDMWWELRSRGLDDVQHMDYFTALSTAKVMIQCKTEETFGIAVVESAYVGVVPVMPKRLSYRELLPMNLLYQTPEEAVDKVLKWINMDGENIARKMHLLYMALTQHLEAPRKVIELLLR